MNKNKPSLRLNDAQLAAVRETFDLADDNSDGKITFDQACVLFRVLGQTVSEKELKSLLLESWPNTDSRSSNTSTSELQPIEFDTFVKIFRVKYKTPYDEATVIEAFEVFDPEHSGNMKSKDFLTLMTTTGEPIPPEDAEDILLLANTTDDGIFDYALLAKRLVEGPKNIRVL
ncbi:EF hand family protein [Cryptosporidium serpentis]